MRTGLHPGIKILIMLGIVLLFVLIFGIAYIAWVGIVALVWNVALVPAFGFKALTTPQCFAAGLAGLIVTGILRQIFGRSESK